MHSEGKTFINQKVRRGFPSAYFFVLLLTKCQSYLMVSGDLFPVCGHTHHAEICEEEGVTIINPGTCMKYCPSKTFVYLVINGKKITAVINDYALQNA